MRERELSNKVSPEASGVFGIDRAESPCFPLDYDDHGGSFLSFDADLRLSRSDMKPELQLATLYPCHPDWYGRRGLRHPGR